MALNKIDKYFIEDLEVENYINLLTSVETLSEIGWTVYNDGASSVPIDGIGGTANITLSKNTTSPLSGEEDIRLVKDAFNQQGQGFSIPFTIANRHLGKVLQITFDTELISGTFSTGDLEVYIIQDPTGTPVGIEPVNVNIQLGIANQRIRHIASFQTNISITSYRLCIHVSSTSTSAYTVDFANFRVWEPVQSIGTIITDWQSYTPTFTGWGTQSFVSAYWRRNGGNLELDLRYTYATTTAVEARISLPSGLVSSSFIPTIQPAGTVMTFSVVTGPEYYPLIEPNVSYITFGRQSSATAGLTKLNGNSFGNATVSFKCFIPIQGWGSSVAMSSDSGDGRVVAINYTGTSSTAISPIRWDTRVIDTHNAYNSSTGVFTVPISGVYRVSATYSNAAANTALILRRNGVNILGLGQEPVINYNFSGSAIISANAGDTIDLIASASTTATSILNQLSIERISAGSQVIAASETVACEVWTDTTTTGSTTTNFIFNRVNRDTHSAWNTTTGIYTAPMSGWYSLTVFLYPNSGYITGQYYIYKASVGGSLSIYKTIHINNSNTTTSTFTSGSFYLLSGEQISIRPSVSWTAYGTTTLASSSSWLTINRVGN